MSGKSLPSCDTPFSFLVELPCWYYPYRGANESNFISFGNNIVASADKEYHGFVNEYIHKYEFYHCFETPNIHWLDEQFQKLDVLGVGAYDNGKLIGLAGCSADAVQMWKIGVDVLSAYRRKGIAASLVNCLAFEILNRGMIPFYCCAWSNLRSAKTAIKAGFRPSWVEMTVKPIEVVNKMNK